MLIIDYVMALLTYKYIQNVYVNQFNNVASIFIPQ
jgi:hypothetical protein